MSGLNVEFQEAEPSWVMYLGCDVNRGRIERLKGDTFSCPGRVSLGMGNLGGQRELVARLHGGRTFEETVKFAVEENGRTGRVGGFVGKVVW